MRQQPAAAEIVIHAPAKLNLFLEVLTKRNDGFHEIETLMCPVNLYDTLYFREETRGPVTLRCEFSIGNQGDGESFPAGSENLAVRALELLRRDSGCQRGASVRLVKRIPTAAGLAGGSSDAAAALVAGNRGWGLGYTTQKLVTFATQLGSDVPFFLTGGPAVCRGRGERASPVRRICPLHFVIVKPPEGLSTAAVYRACRPAEKALRVEPLLEALEQGDLKEVGHRLHNRLQSPARELCPWMGRMEMEFGRLDLPGHMMSGSGTSYFGICRSARQARGITGRLRSRNIGQVYQVASCREQTINYGQADKTAF